MPLPYRTSLRLPDDVDVIRLAEQEVQDWIEKRKKVDSSKRTGFINGAFFEPGVHDLGSGRSLAVAHSDRVEDGSRRRYLRFTESNAAGKWRVDAVAMEYADSGQPRRSLIVEAFRIDDPDGEGEVDPPGLVKQLLAEQDVQDGVTPVTAKPRLVGPEDVDIVFNAITDKARTVSVIVAGSLGPSFDEKLRSRVDSLTSKLTGAASVFVLTQDATRELNQRLPRTHAVDVGHVRTFMPRVDLGNPADGHNHRFLGPSTLARAIDGPRVRPYLQSAFAVQTRARQLSSPLPTDIRRQRRLIDAALEDVLSGAVETATEQAKATSRKEAAELEASAKPSRAEQSPYAQLRGRARRLLTRVLGKDVGQPTVEDFDAAEAEHDRLQASVEAARANAVRDRARFEDEQEARESLREDFEYQGLELVEAQEEIGRVSDELHYLRMEMLKQGLGEQAYAYVRDTTSDTPSDLSELALTLLPDTSKHVASAHIVFTGDLDQVLGAQQRDGNGLVVQRAWKAIRVLHDYARLKASKEFSGSVATYLDSDKHNGAKVPAAWHARGETPQTMEQWGDERVFPVPTSVDPTGQATMTAHFKCDSSNTFATRMHYFDDTDGSGKIYVGYIGRHRTNTQTKNA
ncbi:keratin [Demequina sp. TTPB684]|uniref:keratin n=1 Tax=unclassified Demequina TaxID=2620311 RepID=UPI001CF0F5DB|nr:MULTISPECIES: keratin [unclassified Demequina]MCB2413072.1 keratin [Demequina sp. TTPB684]UPU88120.1 keratin [Demequina sp. TMPB413]